MAKPSSHNTRPKGLELLDTRTPAHQGVAASFLLPAKLTAHHPHRSEMRFLERHTSQIARLAIVGASEWEEVASMVLVATAALQAQTRYYQSSELSHAWHWVKMLKHEEEMPVRIMYPGHGLFQDYTPEYMGI